MKKITILVLFMTLILSMNGITVGATTLDMDDLGDFIYRVENFDINDNPSSDSFGDFMTMDDRYVVVGVPLEDYPDTSSGVVYIFDVDDGSLLATIENPNNYGTVGNDSFGISVSIDDNYVVVGAIGEDNGGSSSGIAYVFDISDIDDIVLWRTLYNPNMYNTGAYDSFGYYLDAYNGKVIISATGEDDASGNGGGAIYLMDLYTGNHLLSISNPNHYGTVISDSMASSVKLTDDYIIAGVKAEDDIGGTTSGVVYIFDVDDGTLLETLENPNETGTSANDNFGWMVNATDDYIVVSAYGEDDSSGILSGAIYIYDITDFSYVRTIENPSCAGTGTRDLFGSGIDVFENYLIVGAYGEDFNGSQSGTAYVFDMDDGTLLETIQNPSTYNGGGSDEFGTSVLINNDNIFISAPNEGNADNVYGYYGAIYKYEGILLLNEYTMSFNTNGGSSIADITQDETTTLTPPDNPTKDGYSFVGWYSDIFLINEYTFSDFPSEDITLYARWVEGGSGGSAGGGLTNNFMFMLVAIILYLTMLFLRFTTGVRIWNLFGVGILIYFIIQFSSMIPMVIVLVGFVIYQLYDTFFGGK